MELNSRLKRGTPLKSPKAVEQKEYEATRRIKKITPLRDVKGPVTPLRKKQKYANESPENSVNNRESPVSPGHSLRKTRNQTPVKSSNQKNSSVNDETLTKLKRNNRTPVKTSSTTANKTSRLEHSHHGGNVEMVDGDVGQNEDTALQRKSSRRTPSNLNQSQRTKTTKLEKEKSNSSLSMSRVTENKMEEEVVDKTDTIAVIRRSPRKRLLQESQSNKTINNNNSNFGNATQKPSGDETDGAGGNKLPSKSPGRVRVKSPSKKKVTKKIEVRSHSYAFLNIYSYIQYVQNKTEHFE